MLHVTNMLRMTKCVTYVYATWDFTHSFSCFMKCYDSDMYFESLLSLFDFVII